MASPWDSPAADVPAPLSRYHAIVLLLILAEEVGSSVPDALRDLTAETLAWLRAAHTQAAYDDIDPAELHERWVRASPAAMRNSPAALALSVMTFGDRAAHTWHWALSLAVDATCLACGPADTSSEVRGLVARIGTALIQRDAIAAYRAGLLARLAATEF